MQMLKRQDSYSVTEEWEATKGGLECHNTAATSFQSFHDSEQFLLSDVVVLLSRRHFFDQKAMSLPS